MNPLLRALLGPAYPAYVRVRHGETVRELSAAMGWPAYIRQRRACPDALAVDIAPRMGMGAVIAKALLFHALAEDSDLAPAIVSSNPLYCPPSRTDFLAQYFERPAQAGGSAPLRGRAYQWALRKVAPAHLSLARAAQLFARYFRPGEIVRDAVSAAMAGRRQFDLSIHYRGSDKFLESGTVDRARLFREIDAIGAGPADIFLATDEPAFEQAIRQRYPQHCFTTYNLDEVPAGVPRHFSDMKPERKALEAVANIFLLASAPLCIRTSSYLSAISKIACPELRTRTVNRTIHGSTGFPEHEVIAAETARSRQ